MINKQLKRLLNFLKSYLAIIVLIPTIIGGLWQFFELLDVGYPFLRFFSLTQMAPDGILMLFILPISFLISVPAFFIYFSFNDLNKSKIVKKIVLVIFFLITLITNYIFLEKYIVVGQILMKPTDIDKFVIFSYLLLSYLFFTDFKFKNKSKNKLNSSLNSFWNVFSIFWGSLTSLIFIISFIRIVNIIGYNNAIPRKMINTQFLYDHIEREYGLEYGFFHIAYFNDKYIFVKYHPEDDFHVFKPISNDYFYGVLVIRNQDGLFPKNGFKVEY